MMNGKRFFIVAVECDSDSDYYMEQGWIYYHDPATMVETDNTIGLDNEFHPSDYHEQAPKHLLLEITQDDYDLLSRINELGYDSANMQDQIIKCRKEDGSNDKNYAVS